MDPVIAQATQADRAHSDARSAGEPGISDRAAYLALCARDARFDGRLFVGVTSTGIYCRPICRVRTPRADRCRFFALAAAAEAAGFRPCLRCRPELAPGLSRSDSSSTLAREAAQRLAWAVREGQALPVATLATQLGVSARHLQRIFVAAHGVAPLDYVTTQRLLLAKAMLTDTTLAVTDIALRCGFQSLRRFNAAFAERYRMPPSALRKDSLRQATPGALPLRRRGAIGTSGRRPDEDSQLLRLGYRPPYDAAGLLHFLARRCLPGVEQVHDGEYRRTLAWPHQGRWLQGWIAARPVSERHEWHIRIAAGLAPALGSLSEALRQAFDLDAEPERIDAAMQLVPGPSPAPAGLRLPGGLDGFEVAVRTVLGQQVTVAAARTLCTRLVLRFGQSATGQPEAGLTHFFPQAKALAAAREADIGELGIVRQRAAALQALARAVAEGQLVLNRHAPLQGTLTALQALPGIGPWSAQLIAMRALAWPDAFVPSDIGVLKALGTRSAREAERLSQAWRPWRAYAVMRLWQNLDPA
jgi:AraC family transcriptional regulator, regulatory protein of adaptative response / DNA-3-methyladenine glycosylase II